MSAPSWPDPFATVKAEFPFRFASDFARLTSWVDPNESAAGRFSPDMVQKVERRSTSGLWCFEEIEEGGYVLAYASSGSLAAVKLTFWRTGIREASVASLT